MNRQTRSARTTRTQTGYAGSLSPTRTACQGLRRQAHRTVVATIPLIACFVFASSPVAAQHQMRPPAGTVTLDGGATRTIIPFELVNHHVILPVTVGDAELRIVLDTGMPSHGLLLYSNERTAEAKIAFDPNMRAQIGGAGGHGERIFAQIAPGASFTLPGVSVSGTTVTKLPELPHFPGYHDGIIGFSLFDRFVVDLDFENQILTLVEPGEFRPLVGDAGIPFELVMGVPHIQLAVAIEGGEPFSTEVVVDLGASHALSLNTDASDAITIPTRSIASPLGRGLSGQILGRTGRIDAVVLGGHRMADVPVSFPQSAHQNPRRAPDLGGNLGTGVLSRFRVAFDYSRRRMWVRPRESFAAPFPVDRSGIVLGHNQDEGLLIDTVIEGSPAQRAGLSPGDRIVRFEGLGVGPADRFRVRERLEGEGTIRCTVRSGAEDRDVRLQLADLI